MGYKVTCKCGHDREITKEQYKNGWIPDLCWDCWKELQNKEREKDNTAIRDEQLAKGYPVLEGTEKQVLWAYKLRNVWIHSLEHLQNENYEHDEAYYKGLEILENILKGTSSKFYIDNRYKETVSDVFSYINNIIFPEEE